jgi:hypothetical protein
MLTREELEELQLWLDEYLWPNVLDWHIAKGRRVRGRALDWGERAAITLCYFDPL